jgi:hypothetical protein
MPDALDRAMRNHLALLMCVAACAPADDGADVAATAADVVATQANDLHPAVVRFSGAPDSFGQQGYHTGLLVFPGKPLEHNSSGLVLTTLPSLSIQRQGQCAPQLTVEHGFVFPGSPRNDPVQRQVVHGVVHPWLPLALLALDSPIDVTRPPPLASGLPAPGSDMKCVGYAPGGSLFTLHGFARTAERTGYLFEAAVGQELHTTDTSFVCTDIAYSTVFGLSLWDDDWDDKMTGLNEQTSVAGLGQWIAAQDDIARMFAPTQLTPIATLRNAQTGLCAEVPSFDFGAVAVNQAACRSQRAQSWYQSGGFRTGPNGSQIYVARYVNTYEGKCLTAGAGGVRQASCNLNDMNQSWELIPVLGGNAIKNQGTGTCMDGSTGGPGRQLALDVCPSPGASSPVKTWSVSTALVACSPR